MKASAEAQVTDAEKILIRALASSRQISSSEDHVSMRDGADEAFDPARQAAYVMQNEGLHRGLATESLVDALLNAPPDAADVLDVPSTESDRRLLASILLKEEEELTAEIVDAAAHALRKIALDRRRQEIGRALERPGNLDRSQQIELAQERLRMKLAKRSPDSRVELPPNSPHS